MVANNLFKSRGGQPGGQLNGPQLKRLLREESLDGLATQVPHGQEICRYLRSLRDLYYKSVSKTLDLANYREVVAECITSMKAVHKLGFISITPKCHVITSHMLQYVEKMGMTMYCTDGGITESCHSRLRKTEEKYNTKTVHSLGQGNHAQRLKNSLVFHNCSQYGDLQLLKALDLPSTPAASLDTPEPVVEVVTVGNDTENVENLQSELAASRNRILVTDSKINNMRKLFVL